MPESNADFAGQIELDVRDSVPDWSPYELQKAPDGAPNVLVVLYDDTGVASWSPYGGRISMPTMDRLARRAHVHAVAHDGAVLPDPIDHAHRSKPPREPRGGHHGGHQRVPRIGGTPAGGSARRSARSCSRTATRPSGWARTTTSRKRTTPPAGTDRCGPCSSASTGSTDSWGGRKRETNNWYPDLVEDNHFIEAPATPEQGYHLSKDLADQALKMIRNQQASNPSKPWYLYRDLELEAAAMLSRE